MQKNEIGSPHLTPYTKINSEWVKNLNTKVKTVQLLEENILRINLLTLDLAMDFSDKDQKSMSNKTNKNWTSSKQKILYITGHYHDNPQNGSYVQIIYLIRVKYQEFIKNSYNSTKDKHPNLKMGKGLEHTFLQRRYTNAQQAHEKMLNLVIKGMKYRYMLYGWTLENMLTERSYMQKVKLL